MSKKRIVPIAKVVQDYDGYITESQIRGWITRRSENGFGRCIIRPSQRRLYIDLDEFEVWLGERTGQLMEV